jgi:YHS domain-containing protein
MMLTLAIGALVLGAPQAPPQAIVGPVHCPVMGSPVAKVSEAIDYNGARFEFCCPGCADPFAKTPAKFLTAESTKGKTVGVFLFDPVSGARLAPKDAKGGSSDFGGIRFHFATADNKKTFDAAPKRYGTMPQKEALYCPVMGHALSGGYDKTGGYADHDGVRYYVCCPNCLPKLRSAPGDHAGKASGAVKVPGALAVVKAG